MVDRRLDFCNFIGLRERSSSTGGSFLLILHAPLVPPLLEHEWALVPPLLEHEWGVVLMGGRMLLVSELNSENTCVDLSLLLLAS